MQPHLYVGLFALLTIILAGAAIGCLGGLSASEGAYITLVILVLIGSFFDRRARRRAQQR